MTQTETRKVEMAPGIAAYRHRNGHILTLRWVRESGEQVARHGKITGWAVDSNGEQWLKFRPTGETKPIRIHADALQRHLDAVQQQRQREAALRVDRCEECGKVLDTGPLGHMDEFSGVPGLCFNCA